MKILKLLIKNAMRHKLRTVLTMLGIAVTVMAFVLMQMIVGAFYAYVDVSAADRLITRHAVSFVFHLPLSYWERFKQVPGVSDVTYAVWFQGYYKENAMKYWFPRMAVNSDNFFKVYSEYVVPPDQFEKFKQERNSCIVGIKSAEKFGFKIGDVIPIKGDIYPGKWEFVVRGIYKGRDRKVDETQMFFHWKYLDERMRQDAPSRAGLVGWYIVSVDDPKTSPRISASIDDMFKNSSAETKSETEKAFNLSFISMYSALFTVMNFVSFVIIGIILLVLANTMAMTARERTTEYAVLKTLGFTTKHLALIVAGESIFIAAAGGVIGLLIALPMSQGLQAAFITMFPIMPPFGKIGAIAFSTALIVGAASAFFPVVRVSRMSIVEGLRHIG